MSDLREALEKLIEAQGPNGYVMTYALKAALANHPVEPDCNCGFGGFHDDANPHCDRNQAEVDPETGFARPLLDRVAAIKHLGRSELAAATVDHLLSADLVRPMPTREQIGEALSTHYHDPVFGCECTPMRGDDTKEELDGGWPEHLGEIVLALLNGTDQTTKE